MLQDTITETTDVLIIGAGISGIGAAYYLQKNSPQKKYIILERRERLGGTWDLFKYPGIRSDSDMFTLGYEFKPWVNEQAIADGPRIWNYLHETANENGILPHIRYNKKAVTANWDSKTARWLVTVQDEKSGEAQVIACKFLFMGAGYYNYDEGYTPQFEGRDDFKGEIIHPQFWPEDFDYTGKRVVVIGSGATAVTLIPSMTDKAEHVVMLQRSPSYVMSRPQGDGVNRLLRKIFSDRTAYRMTRWKNVRLMSFFYNMSRKYPKTFKKIMTDHVKQQLKGGWDWDTHFMPDYNPWDQRVCAAPNADLFRVIKKGQASVVTDHIERFDETGIQLKSGKHLDADVIITATGLNLQLMGGITLSVDGQEQDLSTKYAYKSMMFSDIPNLVNSIGYTNASWTLKTDLTCEYVTRLLNHMDEKGLDYAVPRQDDPNFETENLLDFTSGYVQRSIHMFPKQGTKEPWKTVQNFVYDRKIIRHSPIDDGVLEFGKAEVKADAEPAMAAE